MTPTLNSAEADNLQTAFLFSDVLVFLNDSVTITTDVNAFNFTSSPLSLDDVVETSTDVITINTTSSSILGRRDEVVLCQEISEFINFWTPPFLFLFGVTANIMVVVVLRSGHFRHMSTSFYMAVSAVVDTVSLMVPFPAHYLYVNFPHIFDKARDDHIMCSFFHVFGWVSSNLGVYLTVAMTVDRSLAIQFPLKAPTLSTVRRAKIVTVCLLVLELLKDGHLAFTARVVPKEVTAYLCEVDRDFSNAYRIFHDYHWPYINNISLLLSFVTIIIGNVIIALHVKKSEDTTGIGAKSIAGSKLRKTSSKSRQLSLMLIVDSFGVIICMLPFSVYVLLDRTFQLFVDTPQGRGSQNLIFSVTFYLLYVNRFANFFLYCISGARFRLALKEILCRKSSRKKEGIVRVANLHKATAAMSTPGDERNEVRASPVGPLA